MPERPCRRPDALLHAAVAAAGSYGPPHPAEADHCLAGGPSGADDARAVSVAGCLPPVAAVRAPQPSCGTGASGGEQGPYRLLSHRIPQPYGPVTASSGRQAHGSHSRTAWSRPAAAPAGRRSLWEWLTADVGRWITGDLWGLIAVTLGGLGSSWSVD